MPDLSEIYLGDGVASNIRKAYEGNTLVFERGSSFDPLIQAYLDKCTSEGYTAASGDELTAMNQLILDLVDQGIINTQSNRGVKVSDYLDIFYILSTNNSGDSDAATLNLLDVDSFQLMKVNSPTYGAGGFTGGGTSYLNTNWNPNSNGVNFTLNSAGLGLYARTLEGGTSYLMGSRSSGNSWTRALTTNSNDIAINQGSARLDSGVLSTGFWQGYRQNSNDYKLIVNNSEYTDIDSTGVLSSQNFYLCGFNNNGSLLSGSNQISIAFVGGDVSSLSSEFYAAVQTYMTSIGLQV